MNKTAITSPELALPAGPFSQAIEVGGFLYFSGQVGQDPATGKVGEGGIVAETESVFRNLSAVLKAAGQSFDHAAGAGVYLANTSDFSAMNGIYAKHFSQPFPARTTIGVAALPLGACVEIDLVVKARGGRVYVFWGKENDMRIRSVSHSSLMLIASGTVSLILVAESARAAPRAQADLVEF